MFSLCTSHARDFVKPFLRPSTRFFTGTDTNQAKRIKHVGLLMNEELIKDLKRRDKPPKPYRCDVKLEILASSKEDIDAFFDSIIQGENGFKRHNNHSYGDIDPCEPNDDCSSNEK